jgi:pteridine reductase
MPNLQQVFDCDSPVALVTGSGAPRVGRQIALQLARLGCRLALHANSNVSEAQRVAQEMRDEHSTEVIVQSGSLEEESVPLRLVSGAHEQFGRIDILVNCAAIWYPTKLEAITAAKIRRYFEVNALGTFMCARAAGMRMRNQDRGGSIINMGDWATARPYLDHAAYFPSKGAVEAMTRSLAVELAHWNPRIRVNCIQPGPVMLSDDTSPEHAKRLAASTLVGRIGTPEHIAHAVQFLCENDFTTGICLPVDGGRSIYAPDGLQAGINLG